MTINQAKIYIVLSDFGPATAKEVSKLTRINRQDIYRILPTLQQRGMVEKAITAPNTFKAVPIKLAVSMLLRQKTAQHNDLKERVKKIAALHGHPEKVKAGTEDPQFILIPENDAVIQRIKKATANVKTSLDIVTSRRRRPRATLEFSDARMRALKRGAKIRVATEPLELVNRDLYSVFEAERNAGTVTRYLSAPPPAIILIFDNKEVILITSPEATLETSGLWSNNAALIALARAYFETLWNTAANEDKLPMIES